MRKLTLFLFLIPALHAANISSATCQFNSVVNAANATCFAADPAGLGVSTVVFVVPSFGTSMMSGGITFQPNSAVTNTASFSAFADSFNVMDTPGPVRNGFLQITTIVNDHGDEVGSGTTRASGNATAFYDLTVGPDMFHVDAAHQLPTVTALIPFTLGVPFLEQFNAVITDFATNNQESGAGIHVNTSLAFFEANGTTPVTPFFSTTPEPATWGLMAMVLALMTFKEVIRRVKLARSETGS